MYNIIQQKCKGAILCYIKQLPKNQIHIDNIENKGIIDYLIKNDLIKDKLVGTTAVNSWEYPIAELNMKKFNIDT